MPIIDVKKYYSVYDMLVDGMGFTVVDGHYVKEEKKFSVDEAIGHNPGTFYEKMRRRDLLPLSITSTLTESVEPVIAVSTRPAECGGMSGVEAYMATLSSSRKPLSGSFLNPQPMLPKPGEMHRLQLLRCNENEVVLQFPAPIGCWTVECRIEYVDRNIGTIYDSCAIQQDNVALLLKLKGGESAEVTLWDQRLNFPPPPPFFLGRVKREGLGVRINTLGVSMYVPYRGLSLVANDSLTYTLPLPTTSMAPRDWIKSSDELVKWMRSERGLALVRKITRD